MPLHVGGDMEKTAFSTEMRSKLHPAVQDFVKAVRPTPSGIYVLVNALGAGEYWGSNVNGDFFPEKALIHAPADWDTLLANPEQARQVGQSWDYGFPTFMGAHPYKHHVNKDPSRAFGRVELATWNPKMHRVELVVYLDRALCMQFDALDIIERIERGEFPDVSMGCKVPFDICSICQNQSKTRADYCSHALTQMNKILPDGRKVCVINTLPKFFDISFVFIGADKTAKVMAKLAQKGSQVCMGDFCTIPRLSADVGEIFTKKADPVDEVHGIPPVSKETAMDERERFNRMFLNGLKKLDNSDQPEVNFDAHANLAKQANLANIARAAARPALIGAGVGAVGGALDYATDSPVDRAKSGLLNRAAKGAVYGGGIGALMGGARVSPLLHKAELVHEGVEGAHLLHDLIKHASDSCSCGCGTCDTGKIKTAKAKSASHAKLSELIKSIPAGPFSKETLPRLERAEPDIPNEVLDQLGQGPLSCAISTPSAAGIVLKPREFQRIMLIRIGERPYADELDRRGMTFGRTNEIDESIPMDLDQIDDGILGILRLLGLIKARSAATAPLRARSAHGSADAPFKPINSNSEADPLMKKIAAAYNGYRRTLLKKANSLINYMTTDPQLSSELFGSSIAQAFGGGISKVASASVLSPESLAYLVGAYTDRDFHLTDEVVTSLAHTGAVRFAT